MSLDVQFKSGSWSKPVVKYLILAVGGSVELQKGTGVAIWSAGVKHTVDLRY